MAKVPAQPITGLEHGPARVDNLLWSRCRQSRFLPLIVHMHNQLSHNNIQKPVFHTCTLNGMVLLPKHHNLLRESLADCDTGRLRPCVSGRTTAKKSSKAKCGRHRHDDRIASGNKSFADFDSAAIESSSSSSAEQIDDARHDRSTVP